MPLRHLVTEILRISATGPANLGAGGAVSPSTPVLVTPSYLSLRPAFFLQLAEELVVQADRPVRFDWYCARSGQLLSLVGDVWASRFAASVNRLLMESKRPRPDDASHPAAVLQITASIGKPSRSGSELIVGLADERLELLSWTTPIWLGDRESAGAKWHPTPVAKPAA